jgi:hypothetical protein
VSRSAAAIIAAVGPEPTTVRDIVDRLGGSMEFTRRTLSGAAARGELHVIHGGTGGRPAVYSTSPTAPPAPESGVRLTREQQRSRSPGRPTRSYAVSRSPALNAALAAELRSGTDRIGHEGRPATRGDCAASRGVGPDGDPLPCPWVSCRHHLAVEVTRAGTLQVIAPWSADDPMELDLDAMAATCALDVADVADESGLGQEQVGVLLNLTRERVRQIETSGLARAEALAKRLGLAPEVSAEPKRRRLPIVAEDDEDDDEREQIEMFAHFG